MQAGRINLLEGDVARHLRRLFIPLTWGLVMITVFGVVDTWFIAQLGTVQLAAFGFVLPVVMLFMGVVFGFSVAATSTVARIYGSGDMDGVRQLATDSLVLTGFVVTTAAVLGYFLIDPVFRWMGASDEMMPLVHDFIHIWYFSLPFLSIIMVGNSCVRATGDTRFSASMMTLQAVLVMIIDPFLIFGWAGLPRMELQGAALALVISYAFCACLSIYVLGYRRKFLSGRILHKGMFKSWGRILHVAGPTILSNQISPISTAIITWLAAGFGKEAVAALGVATRIESVATIVFYAMGGAVAIITGQNHGAGNFGRIKEVSAVATRYGMIWGLCLAGLLWLFAYDLPALFNKDVLVTGFTAQYLHWVPISYGAMGAMVIYNASLNAMGKPLPATVLILLRAVVFYVPIAYVGQRYWGFVGIVAALSVTNFAVGILSYLWNRRVVS